MFTDDFFQRANLTDRFTSLAGRFVAPPRLYIESAEGVREPESERGPAWWVITRARCRFHKVALIENSSDSRQSAALALQIERLSPFGETGSHVHYGAGFASVWLWDKAEVAEAAEAIGLDHRRLRVVPETALVQPGYDDLRLVAAIDGYEGQSWRGGALAASRWWPHVPNSSDWILFQRGASIAADSLTAEAPPPIALAWLDKPWTRSRRSTSIKLDQIDMRLAAAAVGVIALLTVSYFGVEILRLSFDLSSARRQTAAREDAVKVTLDARSAALANIAALKHFREMDLYPSQTEIMAQIAERLPHNETHFTDWSWDRGQLEATVAADHPLDTIFFVRALESIPGFKNVNAERIGGDNTLRLRLSVDSKW